MSYHLFGSLSNILLPMDNLLFPSLIQAKMGAHVWNNPALKNWLTNFGRAVVGAIQTHPTLLEVQVKFTCSCFILLNSASMGSPEK
jgi:hypothetical protein